MDRTQKDYTGGGALAEFEAYLREGEKSPLTIRKYLRDVGAFRDWLGDGALDTPAVLAYKAHLLEARAPAGVNSALSALNGYFSWLGRPECRVRFVRQQRALFRRPERELTGAEYARLLKAARDKPRLYLLLQTICSTGIRVSEHRFITVEAVRRGEARVRGKGKGRTVLLPRELCVRLDRYARERGLRSGSIFVTRSGRPLDRSNIWAEMKKLCRTARVQAEKVFPHNLRHLFARTFYTLQKDIVRLADLLGHTSVNTTRIYTQESGAVHRMQLERMPLLDTT